MRKIISLFFKCYQKNVWEQKHQICLGHYAMDFLAQSHHRLHSYHHSYVQLRVPPVCCRNVSKVF